MGKATRRDLPAEMTTAEFFRWPGDGSGRRFELVDGQLRAMAPPSSTHGIMQSTISRVLGNHFKANSLPCVVATNPPVVPRVGAKNNARSPDLGVRCNRAANDSYDLTEPVLLIEILSPSNKAETWSNVWTYTTIPSVREILVIDSTKVEAKLLTRGSDGTWPDMPQVIGGGDQLELSSIGLTTSCRDFYDSTHLAGMGVGSPAKPGAPE